MQLLFPPKVIKSKEDNMKKKYLKPDAEYISLEAKDLITADNFGAGGFMSSVDNEDDWV